jgi:2'-5' RNA ligase
LNLRLFVALEPPDTVRKRLGAIQAELKRIAGRHADEVKWVPVGNIHLTLQFLGAVPQERLGAIEAALAEAAETARPLSLEVRGAGGFPNARRPRVLWAGATGEVELLAALAAEVGRRLAPLGYPPEERRFSAHLTLGRAREARGAPGLGGALLAASASEGVPWRADALVLFQSHLSPAGPRYEALARIGLGRSVTR